MKGISKLSIAVLGGMLLALVPQAKATTINLAVGDSREVGYVTPGVDFGNDQIPGYVNPFVTMTLNSSFSANYANHYNTWVRTGNVFPLTTVDTSGSYPSQGTITSFNIVSGNEFLVAKYDGPNAGLEVWYIGDLVGDTINIPANASGLHFQGGSGNYGLSGTWVLNGTTPPPPSQVPDGGTTVLLLGSALSGLAFLRRMLS